MFEQTHPDSNRSLNLTARLSELPKVSQFIPAAVIQLAEATEEIDVELVAGDLTIAVHEVCANMINHAYGAEGDGPILVTLLLDEGEKQFVAQVVDHGFSYNPQQMAWPPAQSWRLTEEKGECSFVLGDVPEQEFEAEHGRGIYLLALLLDSVTYKPRPGKNCWILVKNF